MEWQGQVVRIEQDYGTKKLQVTFTVDTDGQFIANKLSELKDEKLSIKATKHRNKRSKDANALLWACIKEISDKLNADKWSVYLKLLKDYGQYTYICVKPNAVEAIKTQWRECEELGRVNINGQESVQMLCYFGSSTYNSQEFSKLLEGTINEMRELGLQPPASEEMRAAIEKWEKQSSI